MFGKYNSKFGGGRWNKQDDDGLIQVTATAFSSYSDFDFFVFAFIFGINPVYDEVEGTVTLTNGSNPDQQVVLSGEDFAYDVDTGEYTGTMTTITAIENGEVVAVFDGLQADGAVLTQALATGDISELTALNQLTIYGSDEDDYFFGGGNPDKMFLGGGNDIAQSGEGNDKVFGGEGDDTLMGEDGDDKIKGGEGNDIITGGVGNDVLSGGKDADTFVFAVGDGEDKIRGFNIDEDVIQIDVSTAGLSADDIEISAKNDHVVTISYGEDSIKIIGYEAGDLTIDDLVIV